MEKSCASMFRASCEGKHRPSREIAPGSFRTVHVSEAIYQVRKGQFLACCILILHSDLTFKERQRCRDEAQILLTRILRMENTPLFTQNSDYIAEDSKWISTYMNHRSYSSQAGSDTWTVEDEIRVMASVQAYFQVSYKASTFSLV